MVSAPVTGAPTEFENSVQEAAYALLDRLGVSYARVTNDPAVTMEDCKAIDEAFGVSTIKTVFLTNRQQTRFYLLAMPGDKPFVTRHFSAALGVPRVSFASAGLLLSMLGTPHGAATPLSVVNDSEDMVKMIVDAELLDRERIVCPDCALHGYVCLPVRALTEVYLPAASHTPVIVTLS